MTPNRYLMFVPDRADDTDVWRRIEQRLAPLPGFRTIRNPLFCLVAQGEMIEARHDPECQAVVIGTLFRREDQIAATGLSPHEARATCATGGETLIRHFWGNYVALLADDRRRVKIVRAPFGDLACYHCRCAGGMLIASDLDLMIRAGPIRPQIDWDAIALQLIAPDIRRPRTCLKPIHELAGGDSLSLGQERTECTLWTPWTFVAPERRCDDRERAAAMLADIVCGSVAALTRPDAANVLLLSGGLDSSIVAAALKRAGRACTALTMVTHAAGGDERDYARATARHCGIPLREVLRETAAVDVTRTAAAGLPYPSEKAFTQATAAAAAAIAHETGARAVLHGGGGDNIFCALQSAAPLADLIKARGLDRRAVRLTQDIAINAQATSGAVLKQAGARLLRRSPRYHWEPKLGLLSPAGLSHQDAALRHPWLDTPRGALSGSAGHIGLVLAALSVAQSPDARTALPWRAVLLTQPVIEACLSIPSWLWFERGRNRAVARHAFSPMLPETIAWRPSKGAMDSFIVEIFDANRRRLKAMLHDGMLARRGLIDGDAVARVLDDPGPVRGRDFGRVMQFAETEAWLTSWT